MKTYCTKTHVGMVRVDVCVKVSLTCYTTHLKLYLSGAYLPMALADLADRGRSVGWL